MTRFDSMDPIYFIYIGIFVGVVLSIEGLRQAFFSGDDTDATRSRRMKLLRKGMSNEQVLTLLHPTPKETLLSRIPVYGTLPNKMRQAGMRLTPVLFLTGCAVLAFAVFVLVSAVLGPVTAGIVALLTGSVIPMSIINIIRKKRVEMFTEQLPDALDLMTRGLRVGHPLNVTIANVASNMPDPIATEFGIVADQITYGDELTEAFFGLADRIDQEDMHYLAVSVSIQHGTGGNLAAMLGTLSRVIRARFAMRRRISAISSEGRISAWVLSSLPFLMYGATSLTAPGYYASVKDDPLYLPIALAILGLVIANFLTLRKLVSFRI